MTWSKLKKIIFKTSAGLLAIWLSGAVFLLCCEKINAKAADKSFCPMARMSVHCDKQKQTNPSPSFTTSSEELCLDCCGFLPAVFDKARKLETAQKQFAATPKLARVNLSLPLSIAPKIIFYAFHSRVSDRQRTFVENCVFRI